MSDPFSLSGFNFDEVAELEAYLAGSDKSYAEVKAEDAVLVENVSSGAAIAMNTATMSDPPIFSAFMLGCLLNVVGIVIVMLTTEMDTHYVMKSFWGCVTSSALYVILWVLSNGMPR
ncbi:MAG: hypothetical protein K9H26_11235 [Prolixibacteraceae bacterium]|nr:hypothetical protein [Prolixibacteraceae bacterium]